MKKFSALLLMMILGLSCIACQEPKKLDTARNETNRVAQEDTWTVIDQYEIDVDGDQKTDTIKVWQVKDDLDTGFKLKVTYKSETFEQSYPGMSVAPEVMLLDSGALGHSLLVILNGSESQNISLEELFYDEQYGAIFFDFNEEDIRSHYVDFNYTTADGKDGITLSIKGQNLTVQDYKTGMGCTVTLELNEEQIKRLAAIDSVEYYKGFNRKLYDSIKVTEDGKQVIFEKVIPGVMHQDTFATIRLVYTYTDGLWQCLEEHFISENPATRLIHRIAPISETVVN